MRSPSPADDIPHSASRTVSLASHRDHLSLFADNDDDFYSQSEDNQDLAPDTEIQHVSETQSEISTDDMGFLNFVCPWRLQRWMVPFLCLLLSLGTGYLPELI